MADGFQAVPGGRINIEALKKTPGGLMSALQGEPEGLMSALQGELENPNVKALGGGIFADWLIRKLTGGIHKRGLRKIELANLRNQAELLTPQNLYYQAALPQAQEEESMARNALLGQLSGGVLGPQLAKGEYMIGG